MKQTFKYFVILIIEVFLLYNPIEAKTKSKKSVNADELLKRGREAFYNYDFEEAADLYDEYRSLKSKAKEEPDEELEIWETELSIASNAFERVQKVVIIDSISIDESNFFKAYKLANTAGGIGPVSSYLSNVNMPGKEIGFISEGGDYSVFPQINSDGDKRLMEANLLLDGQWEIRETLEGDFDKSGDYMFPFMSGDGQTLYFANDGEESMGGFDLFVAQKDPLTGEFLQPLNLGMPFNSPYDDYMLALDEETGVGWWATNRNSKDGTVTIFVYLIEDIRKNYSPDIDELPELAKVSDYKATWEEGKEKEYRSMLEKIKNLK